MKKIYQIPALRVTHILLETVVATSLQIDSTTTVETQYTKEDNADWSDIWSE
ncbi:MAG: hypothetical protein IJ767_06285 [Bacteroidaceae bacterium]|nr:hypothetical protein [Bacteroidaceae bacterium]